ncbi:trigger factor [Prolixibacteraceae bacterium JC049]|nr:trigger factor [Prolixibacteraceae bacterium JC049]
MNITRENIDELNGVIKLSIVPADYDAAVNDVLKNYRKKAQIPGFRPGKVPAGLVKKMYGKAVLVEEVNKILSKELTKYIFDEKLNILGEPLPNDEQTKDIDWEKDTEFDFVFDVAFAPEFKITLDKRSKYSYYTINVDEEMIDKQVEALAGRAGENQDTEVVEEKETVRADFVQVDEQGNEVENAITADEVLVAVDMIKDEEIQKEFIGKKKEDVIVFDIKKAFPNDHEIAHMLNIAKEDAEALEGNFKATIKVVQKFVPAEVNEDLFKQLYGEETEIKTVEDFRAKIKTELEQGLVQSSEYKFLVDARETLLSKTKMELPKDFLSRWLLATNKELTAEQIEKDWEHFDKDLRWQLIKDKIVKENELKVEEEEVREFAKEVAAAQFRQYGMFDLPEEYLNNYADQIFQKEEERQRLFQKKMEDKIAEFVKSKVNIEEKAVSQAEFDKMFE